MAEVFLDPSDISNPFVYICFRGANKNGGMIGSECYKWIKDSGESCYFYPRPDNEPFGNYIENEEHAIDSAKCMLLILTPDFFRGINDDGDAVSFELELALKKNLEKKKLDFLAVASDDFSWGDDISREFSKWINAHFPNKEKEVYSKIAGIDYPKYVSRQSDDVKKRLIKALSSKKPDWEKLNNVLSKYDITVSDTNGQFDRIGCLNSWDEVYFPVVPRKSINEIHLTFITIIQEIIKCNVKVRVLIFDDYQYKLDKERATIDVNEEDTKRFISYLTSKGIPQGCIYRESQLLKDYEGKGSFNIFHRFIELSATFTYESMWENKKDYIKDKTPFIRMLKPFMNIIYMELISGHIGFILCGEDEVSIWKTYFQTEIGAKNSKVILSMPKMSNAEGKSASVREDNLIFANLRSPRIKELVVQSLKNKDNYKPNNALFYLLEYNYFKRDCFFEFIEDGNRIMKIQSTKDLINYLNSLSSVPDRIVDELTQKITELFRINKGDLL